MAEFTHFNEQGRAKMVDVGEKPVTVRTAVAAGRVLVNRETFEKIRSGAECRDHGGKADARCDSDVPSGGGQRYRHASESG